MSSSLAALALAALLAAEPAAPATAPPLLASASAGELAFGELPTDALDDLVLNALPPPPSTVVRQTRYYGTVTIDHRAHLARRNSCRACHGRGVVTTIVFTPRVAHERCIGCHTAEAKGPTKCQGCHVKAPPPPLPVIVAAAADAPRPPPGPNPENVAAALAAFETGKTRPGSALGKEPFHRWLQVGVAAGSGQGASVRLASHQDRIVLSQSLERMSSRSEARTIGLFGVGLSRPVAPGVSVEALALAGFDVLDRPVVALLPAIGARAGVAWRPRLRFVPPLGASLCTVVDVTRRAFHRDVGGTTVYATISTGFRVP